MADEYELPGPESMETPEGNPPEHTSIDNSTGRNASYLDSRKKPFNPDKVENKVILKKGGEYDNTFAAELALSLPENREIELTEENLDFLTSFSKKMKDGYQAAIPMICMSNSCPYHKHCPLLRQGLPVPHLKECPVETHLFNSWVSSRCKELDIDIESDEFGVDRSQVREYAELEIIQYRAALEMAEDPLTVSEKTIGMDDEGKPIKVDVENPRISIINKLNASKGRILNDLVATRKSRLAAGDKPKDAATAMSEFASKAKERQEKIEAKKEAARKKDAGEIIDVEVNIADDE